MDQSKGLSAAKGGDLEYQCCGVQVLRTAGGYGQSSQSHGIRRVS